jgi:hypothetical protein
VLGSGVGLGVGDSLTEVLSPGTVMGLAEEAALLVGVTLVLGGSACWLAVAHADINRTEAATMTPNRARRPGRAS